MNKTKFLPLAAAALAIPGIGLRALHLLNGFDVDTGLPTAGSPWVWVCTAFFALCAVLYGVLAAPLREQENTPFERLFGTENTLFRMTTVIAAMLLIACSAGYLYFTFTADTDNFSMWARILEIVYSLAGIGSGVCMIAFTKAQSAAQLTSEPAKCVLLPLFWSAIHLLVNYRMTCTDPVPDRRSAAVRLRPDCRRCARARGLPLRPYALWPSAAHAAGAVRGPCGHDVVLRPRRLRPCTADGRDFGRLVGADAPAQRPVGGGLPLRARAAVRAVRGPHGTREIRRENHAFCLLSQVFDL